MAKIGVRYYETDSETETVLENCGWDYESKEKPRKGNRDSHNKSRP